MVAVIPRYFEENIIRKHSEIQLIIDVSNINIATTLDSYGRQLLCIQKEINQLLTNMQAFEINVNMQYNSRLESAYMFIPGNIALIMIIVTANDIHHPIKREGNRKLAYACHYSCTSINHGNSKIIPYMIIS